MNIRLIQTFKKASPAAKASIALLGANFVLKGLSLISGPIFTRLMSTEQFGIVSTFGSWQNLLVVIVTLNLSQGVFNNGMMEFREDRDVFQFSLVAVTSVLTLAAFLLYCLFREFFVDLFELPVILIHVMFLYFLFTPAYGFWSGRQRYEYKYKALTCITIGIAAMSLIIGIIAVVLVPPSETAVARVCVMEGVNILVGAFFFVVIAVRAKFKISMRYCRYAISFNLPLLPHYLSMYVLSSSDRIMITKMVSASATAIYSVAYTVASVINIFWQSIEASLSPWIYEKLQGGQKEAVKKLTSQVVLFFGMICIMCTLFAPEIMYVLAPKAYSEGIYVIPPVAAGVFFTAIYSLYMRVELFYKQTGFAAIATSISAILNIILNYILISSVGYIAAGYTTMACYALLALLHYLNVKKKKYSDTFDNRFFATVSILVIVLSLIVVWLYSHPILRIGFAVVLLVILFLNRKWVLDIIKRKNGIH